MPTKIGDYINLQPIESHIKPEEGYEPEFHSTTDKDLYRLYMRKIKWLTIDKEYFKAEKTTLSVRRIIKKETQYFIGNDKKTNERVIIQIGKNHSIHKSSKLVKIIQTLSNIQNLLWADITVYREWKPEQPLQIFYHPSAVLINQPPSIQGNNSQSIHVLQ